MDELIDILDANGKLTKKKALKSVAHKKGWFHSTAHIWFYTAKGEILLQQRSKNKITHPLLWDVSVAGHIGAGEQILDAALREIEEEIGVKAIKSNLKKIGRFKSIQRHSDVLIDCEYHHTFLCELKVSLDSLVKQESEVADLKLIPIDQFEAELQDEALQKKYVPHSDEYYEVVINAIKHLP